MTTRIVRACNGQIRHVENPIQEPRDRILIQVRQHGISSKILGKPDDAVPDAFNRILFGTDHSFRNVLVAEEAVERSCLVHLINSERRQYNGVRFVRASAVCFQAAVLVLVPDNPTDIDTDGSGILRGHSLDDDGPLESLEDSFRDTVHLYVACRPLHEAADRLRVGVLSVLLSIAENFGKELSLKEQREWF